MSLKLDDYYSKHGVYSRIRNSYMEFLYFTLRVIFGSGCLARNQKLGVVFHHFLNIKKAASIKNTNPTI